MEALSTMTRSASSTIVKGKLCGVVKSLLWDNLVELSFDRLKATVDILFVGGQQWPLGSGDCDNRDWDNCTVVVELLLLLLLLQIGCSGEKTGPTRQQWAVQSLSPLVVSLDILQWRIIHQHGWTHSSEHDRQVSSWLLGIGVGLA